MKRFRLLKAIGLGLSLIGALSCSAVDEPQPKSPTDKNIFRYRHLETTGLTDEIMLSNGKRVTIKFTPPTNAVALAALDQTPRCNVMGTFPNAAKEEGAFSQRLYIIGKLHPKIEQTPYFVNGPTVERYQYFTMTNWFILTPFTVTLTPEGWLPGDPVSTKDVETFSESCKDANAYAGQEVVPLDSYVREEVEAAEDGDN